MKKIFIIGQATLHWGRLEFGNIGNCYVIEPFFLQLRRVFPNTIISTTFQLSDELKNRMNLEIVPMDYFYGWRDDDLSNAYKEYAIAQLYNETGELFDKTPFIEEVLSSDLIISFSGDIWGQNADFVGPNRFLVGLLKDRVAQLLGKKTAMIAGSPGPFNRDNTLPLAHIVFSNYDYVSNREAVSKFVLEEFGFDVKNVVDSACPAFLFEPERQDAIKQYIKGTPIETKERPIVGFILCGWNLLQGPFSRDNWEDYEFDIYRKLLTDFIEKYDIDICLMSHSNGFELPPNFKLIRGRDFPLIKRFYEIMQKTKVASRIHLLDGLYNPKETKAIIANFDMLISGRVHGAIAALSQNIPTVIIDYGHEPKAHKLRGFAKVAGVEEYFSDPTDLKKMIANVDRCWNNRVSIKTVLSERNIEIKKLIEKQFNDLAILLKSI